MIEVAVYLIGASVALISPAILFTWFFGLRPFVAKHGRARVTAVNWLLSMWADWTTAREIEKQRGIRTWATRTFFGLWAYAVAVRLGLALLATLTTHVIG